MKLISLLFLVVAFAIPGTVFSQARDTLVTDISVLDVVPSYPGGMDKFYRDFAKKFKMPDVEKSGTLHLTFIIDRDGQLNDIKILRGIHPKVNAEVINALLSLKKWTPGKLGGEAVRTQFAFPISIQSSVTTYRSR